MMKKLSAIFDGSSLPISLAAFLLSVLLSACGQQAHVHSEHDEHDGHDHSHAVHGHAHVAPHGGAAVVLGEELYHLEFVMDAASGLLHCYVLDGHMEQFVRIAAESFGVAVEGGPRWELKAVPSRATGETVGDTSHFQAEVAPDWIAENGSFSATVEAIAVKQSQFENVAFRYPEGNEGAE